MIHISIEVEVRENSWKAGTPRTNRKVELSIPESLIEKLPLAEITNTAVQEAVAEYLNPIPEITEREEA